MELAALVVAIVGIGVAAYLTYSVDKRTRVYLARLETILTAEMTPAKYKVLLRLLEDAERSGQKRGTITQNADGNWIVAWAP